MKRFALLLTAFLAGSEATPAAVAIQAIREFGLAETMYRKPDAELLQASDGRLYGTVLGGGTHGHGAVFALNPNGSGFVSVYEFRGGTLDGRLPGSLREGTDGQLYGTCSSGGTYNQGVVYRVQKNGSGQEILHHFGSVPDDGYSPESVIEGSDGWLYGVTQYGGAAFGGQGCVFKLARNGAGYQVLKSWKFFVASDPKYAQGELVEAGDGMLYGVTLYGGQYNRGTVFKIGKDGSGYAVIRSLGATTADAAYPRAGLTLGAGGRLYGSATDGGTYSEGAVYTILTNGTGFGLLHSFDPLSTIGTYPLCRLALGPDGFLYGTTYYGGVFKLTTSGLGISRIGTMGHGVLLGRNPGAGVIFANNGMLYGSTQLDDRADNGILFRMNSNGTASETIRDFSDAGGDGVRPNRILEGGDGMLYGSTASGGTNSQGTVYRMAKDGSSYTQLHHFAADGLVGKNPVGGMIRTTDGTLYGVTAYGGNTNKGTVFRMNGDGSGYQVMHHFQGRPNDGERPNSSLVQLPDGSLVGTTLVGGSGLGGTVFKINPAGTEYTILASFGYPVRDPYSPMGVMLGSNGRLYGTTAANGGVGAPPYGTVFTLQTTGSGFAVLYAFGGQSTDGRRPASQLMEGSDGWLYGTTQEGGNASSQGTIYRISRSGATGPNGSYQVLHRFNGDNQGGYSPITGLVEGRDGNLYGTTRYGGAAGRGTVFRIGLDGSQFLELRSLDGENSASIYVGTDSLLYVADERGGRNGIGEIFALLLPPEVASLHRSVSGTVTIDFVGNPGRIYQIEAANDLHLSEAWELAGSRQADQVGRFQFEESSNSDSRFYRAVSP
jgi:uncharacterized repeat protein (TIGR03803 family)